MKPLCTALAFTLWLSLPLLTRAQEALPKPVVAGVDAHGDPLPRHARARLGSLRFRHGGVITSLRYSSDGKSIITIGYTAGQESSLRIWDARTGQERFAYNYPDPQQPQNQNSISQIAPDATILAVSDGGPSVKLWDVTTRQLLRTLDGQNPGSINAVVFTPDSKRLVTLTNEQRNNESRGILRLWDVATGQVIREMDRASQKDKPIFLSGGELLLSADGKMVVFQANNGKRFDLVQAWNLETGKALPQVQVPDASGNLFDELIGPFFKRPQPRPQVFTSPEIAPDNQTIACGVNDGRGKLALRLWDAPTGKHLRDMDMPGGIRSISFPPGGKTLAVIGNNSPGLALYDIATGKAQPAFAGAERASVLAYSADGKTVALGDEQELGVYDIASGKALQTLTLRPVQAVIGNSGLLIAFAPDGKTLATSSGGLVRLWDIAGGKEIVPVPGGHTAAVYGSAVSPDGKMLATLGEDLLVRLWDPATGKELRQLEAPQPEEGNGPLVLPSANNQVTGRCLVFAPRGQRLAGAWPDGSILVWDTNNGKVVQRLKAHDLSSTIALAFAPNGKALASGGSDGRVLWWDVAAGRVIRQFAGPVTGEDNAPINPFGPPSTELAFSTIALAPDGRTLAAAGTNGIEHNIHIWELSSGAVRQQLVIKPEGMGNGFGFGVAPVAFSSGVPSAGGILLAFAPTGTTLTWTNGTSIRMYDALRGKELRQFAGQDGTITATAFAPSGKVLAAATSSGAVRLWDPQSGTVLTDLAGHRGSIGTLTFLGDDRTLASAGTDTGVLLWDVPAAIADAGRPLAGRAPAELWTELGSANAKRAREAIIALLETPAETVALMRSHLRPTAPADRARLDKLLVELQDNRFTVRKKASEELEKLGELAEPLLQKCLEDNPPLEVKTRVEQLLQKLTGPVTHPERLRALRAIEVLEQLGTADARDVLQTLAKGAAEARLTQEAQTALERVAPGKK